MQTRFVVVGGFLEHGTSLICSCSVAYSEVVNVVLMGPLSICLETDPSAN